MFNRLLRFHCLFALFLAWCWLAVLLLPLSVVAAQPPGGTLVSQERTDRRAAEEATPGPLQAAFWPVALLLAMALSAGTSWVLARRHAPPSAVPELEQSELPLQPAEITTARREAPASSRAQWRAIVWDGQRRHRIALHGRQWSIGAAPGCNLCFPEAGLAALHARISLVGDAIEVTALEPGVFHTGLGSPLSLDRATPLGEGEALLVGTTLRVTLEAE